MRIALSIYSSSDGSVGCHDKQARLAFRTASSGGTYPGSRYSLLNFTPEGIINGTGTELTSYEEDTWIDVEIAYTRGSDQVTQEYTIDGETIDTVTREIRDYEDSLSAIQFQSGDFTNYWDELEILHHEQD